MEGDAEVEEGEEHAEGLGSDHQEGTGDVSELVGLRLEGEEKGE